MFQVRECNNEGADYGKIHDNSYNLPVRASRDMGWLPNTQNKFINVSFSAVMTSKVISVNGAIFESCLQDLVLHEKEFQSEAIHWLTEKLSKYLNNFRRHRFQTRAVLTTKYQRIEINVLIYRKGC